MFEKVASFIVNMVFGLIELYNGSNMIMLMVEDNVFTRGRVFLVALSFSIGIALIVDAFIKLELDTNEHKQQ